MALVKPFRALMYDVRKAGRLDDLVAPPHDVISLDDRKRLLARSPYNVVRLIRPDEPDDAAEALTAWRADGILVRDVRPGVWLLAEDFLGPDGRPRTRRGIVARVRLHPYSDGVILPHERTFGSSRETRLRLLRATRAKLSPILLLHEGPSPTLDGLGAPDIEATRDGVRSRLWRVDADDAGPLLEAIRPRIIIADGHHRYDAALRFHEEDGTEETAYVLAALVSRTDGGLVVFPTHRLAGAPVPQLNGGVRTSPLPDGAAAALARLAELPRDRPAYVLLRSDGAVLAETEPVAPGIVGALDTTAVDRLPLADVRFTPSAEEAERAVRDGVAAAAFLVRAPRIDQVEQVALAGETMPEKSTYFFPKLTSGLLIAPFDE